jgi:hypothetical protein
MEEEDHHAICTAMLSLLLPFFFFFVLAPHLFLKLCACIALLSPVLGFVSLILDSAFVTFIVLLLYWIVVVVVVVPFLLLLLLGSVLLRAGEKDWSHRN